MPGRIRHIVQQPEPAHSNKLVVEHADSEQSIITLKPRGFDVTLFLVIPFALFWNSFLVVWTYFAYTTSILMAIFSIPFWLIGLTMIYGIFEALFRSQEIVIRRRDMIIRKFNLFRSTEEVINYRNLHSIELQDFYKLSNRTNHGFRMLASGANDSGFLKKTPTFSYDGSYYFFGEHLSEKDKEWLVDYLNEKIIPLLNFV